MCTQIDPKDTVVHTLSEHEVDSVIIEDVMEAISDNYQDPFVRLSSSYLREKYYNEHFPYLVRAVERFTKVERLKAVM